MQKHQVKTPEDALVYITDCTLATVSNMAYKTRRQKHEFERQMSIAQTAVNWVVEMGIDVSKSRVAEVVAAGSVNEWARRFMKNDLQK